MTFNPNIPQPGDNLSTSQGQLLNNNSQLNTIFDANHFTWNDATTGNRGMHRKVDFPDVQGSDPVVAGNASVVYAKLVSGVAQLFFANASSVSQVTPISATAAGNGSLSLPNGIIFKWGAFNMGAGVTNTGDISFAGGAFPTGVFVAPIIGSTSADPAQVAGLKLSALTNAKFQAFRTGISNLTYYYIAIGN